MKAASDSAGSFSRGKPKKYHGSDLLFVCVDLTVLCLCSFCFLSISKTMRRKYDLGLGKQETEGTASQQAERGA
jgi:hypothetical protein